MTEASLDSAFSRRAVGVWVTRVFPPMTDGYAPPELVVFNAKSFAKKKEYKVATGEPPLLLFGAKGTKVVYATRLNIKDENPSYLQFIPLELSDEDRQKLKEAYP